MSSFLYHYYISIPPSGQTSEAEWQKDCCLLHTTVMFYQPLRPCQSMAGMFQNIFNKQREHFGLRKWIVRKIGRGLSGCVNHQRPFVLPLSQASRTKMSFSFICLCMPYKQMNFLFYIWLQEKTFFFFFFPKIKKLRQKYNTVDPTEGICVQQVKVEFTILSSVQDALWEP